MFHGVGGYGYDYLPMFFCEEGGIVGWEHLGITFGIRDNSPYLELWSKCDEIRLKKGDVLMLIFQGGRAIELPFHKEGRGKEVRRFKFEIYDELETLSSQLLDKWRYKNKHFEIVGDNTLFCQTCDIPDKETSQLLLRQMAHKIKKVIEMRYHSFEQL